MADAGAETAPKTRTPARKRDADATRARILDAAFDQFSAIGYAPVGIREIAAQAGVAASLVLRYFGSKPALFERALVRGIYERGLFVQDKRDFGRTMARLIVEDKDARLTTMAVLALGDPEAEAVMRRVLDEHILGGLAEWFGGSPAEAQSRAAVLYALMTGFVVQMRLSGGKPPGDAAIAWLARTMQELVDGPAG